MDSAVGGVQGNRGHRRLGQVPDAPAPEVINAAMHSTLETGEDRVPVGRVDGDAPRADFEQGELKRPGLAGLVEAGDPIPGRGVETGDRSQLILR
jgi:hypothetical protein